MDNYPKDQAGPIKVLLIEDNPGDAALIKKYLAQAEAILAGGSAFHVSHVDRLAAGLAYMTEQTFDVALLDLRLPDSQDLETVRRVHNRAPQVPIIVLSVVDGQELALKAVQAGAQDYLLKDAITSSLLARAIQHAIERHSMRQELQANEIRFRRLIENNPDGIVLVDQIGAVRFVNRAAEAMFGRPARALVGEPFGFPVVTTEKAELDILQQDGEMLIAEMHAVTIDRQGERLHLISLRDITERKRVEERVRLVVESTPNAIVVVNDTGKIVLVNSQVEELFGYSRAELIGQPVEILVPRRFRPKHVEDRTNYTSNPKTRPVGKGPDLFARRKDGSEVPVEIGLNPMQTKDGLLILASVVDITARKRMEAERSRLLEGEREARAQAEAAQQRLAFLAEASRVLTSSLDYEVSLEAMAHLTIPDLADWCTVDILEEDGRLRRVAVVHSNPAKVKVAARLREHHPPEPNDSHWVTKVLRSGQADLHPEISDRLAESLVPNREAATIIRQLGLTSAMVVPLLAREQRLGAITLVSAESGRRYGPADLGLAEELARRAAQAVDNARLYRVAQQLNERLEARVMERTAQLEKANYELENEISERRQAQAALAEERNLLRTLIDNLPDYIYIKDRQGQFLLTNIAQAEFMGVARPDELVGKTDFEFYSPELAGQYYADEQAIIGTGQPLIDHEEPNLNHRTGEQVMTETTKVPLRDSQGEIIGLVGISRDITERKKAEAEKKRLNEILEERNSQLALANKELESFSYSVSHDLRAPLRSINGFARILSEDFASQLSPEAQRYLNLVRENARQMGDLIDDLLTFSRLNRQEMKKQPVEPVKMIREVYDELQAEWEGRQVELKIGDLPACKADPALLKQVWVNLLSNSLKYTSRRERAVIEVGCQNEEDPPVYFVKDNGVGFDMEYGDKLFGVFQRLHRAEDFEGTGVGLATVQRIIHRHGGQIWAEAEVDKGATFYFSL